MADKDKVVKAGKGAVGDKTADARSGGSISTADAGGLFEENRAPELHGALEYQSRTSNGKPLFKGYTDLTNNSGS